MLLCDSSWKWGFMDVKDPRDLEAFYCVVLMFMVDQTLHLLGVIMWMKDFMVHSLDNLSQC